MLFYENVDRTFSFLLFFLCAVGPRSLQVFDNDGNDISTVKSPAICLSSSQIHEFNVLVFPNMPRLKFENTDIS